MNKKPAQNEQAEHRTEIFTDAISCCDRLLVPLRETRLLLCQIHGVSRVCRRAMLRLSVEAGKHNYAEDKLG